MPLKLFFRVSVFYFAFALILVTLTRGDDMVAILVGAFTKASSLASRLGFVGIWIVVAACLAMAFFGTREFKTKAIGAAYAFAGIIMFQIAFTMVKTSLPVLVPFFADPFFADLDRWLHGGIDPWVHVYAWADVIPFGSWVSTYMSVWFVPALAFPLILALLDDDPQRIRRYTILYVLSWILIGNVLAALGSSVGPVFYDRVYGGDRFAELETLLATGPVSTSIIPKIQDFLWRVYVENGQAFGSGISAFPSVHVSTAVVFCLYLAERVKLLAPIALLYLAKIQLLSVYTGYHYAIDGYVSILVMVAVWAWLSRHDGAPRRYTDASPDVTPTPAPNPGLISPAE